LANVTLYFTPVKLDIDIGMALLTCKDAEISLFLVFSKYLSIVIGNGSATDDMIKESPFDDFGSRSATDIMTSEELSEKEFVVKVFLNIELVFCDEVTYQSGG